MLKNSKILIIGLGEIGYNNAEYLSQKGIDADGYDICAKAVRRALDAKVIRREATEFHGYDYYMVCISTHDPQNIFIPYFEGIVGLAHKLANEAEEGALIAIESTIPKGMSQKICSILKHRLHVAHIPHRYFGPEKDVHGVSQLRVLAGCESCCTEAAESFYSALNIPTQTVSSIEIAELTKIIENTHRFLEIAFAQELRVFCDNQGMDFKELRAALNSKWNENVLEARAGIGGHCLPKDTRMFLGLLKGVLPSSVVEAAVRSNDLYKQYLTGSRDFVVLESEVIPTRKRVSA